MYVSSKTYKELVQRKLDYEVLESQYHKILTEYMGVKDSWRRALNSLTKQVYELQIENGRLKGELERVIRSEK